ncbi:hypothetical protein [Kocuria sp. KRD140]|uniref:hypothetical protein n=1 Tax=Kocuria sp. KRD140 TaxID=2729723 RepID=UPI0019CFA055|nr:hypothetical protein [Kocuria sp. KRD140]
MATTAAVIRAAKSSASTSVPGSWEWDVCWVLKGGLSSDSRAVDVAGGGCC